MLMINGYKGLGHIDIPDYLVPKVRHSFSRNRVRYVLLNGSPSQSGGLGDR